MSILKSLLTITYITLGVLLCLISFQVYQAQQALKIDYNNIKKDFQNETADLLKMKQQMIDFLSTKQTQRSLGLLVRSGDDINAMIKRMNYTLDNLDTLITRTDTNLNQNIFPNVNKAIDNTSASVQKTLKDLEEPIQNANKLIQSATKAVDKFSKDTTDLAEAWIEASNTINTAVSDINAMVPKDSVSNIIRNLEYVTKRFGDIEDATYAKLIKVKNWMSRILLEIGGWFYRVFIKP